MEQKSSYHAGNDVIGLDMAASNTNANLRVIQNTNSSIDKHIYIGFNSGAVSSTLLYSNNNLTLSASAGNVVCGNAAIATTATNGFLYIPSCAGIPTGIPTTNTGRAAMVYDSTNNRMYVYNGAWRSMLFA